MLRYQSERKLTNHENGASDSSQSQNLKKFGDNFLHGTYFVILTFLDSLLLQTYE